MADLALTLGEIFPLAAGAVPSPPETQQTLKTIRTVHHRAARLFASGSPTADVALATGIGYARLTVLRQDPTFSELVAHYARIDAETFQATREKLAFLGETVAEVLHERVLEEPGAIPTKDLTALLATALDRGGFAPVHKHEVSDSRFSPEDVAALKAAAGRARQHTREVTIEGEILEDSKSDNTTSLGKDLAQTSLSSETLDGSSGEGESV